MRSKEPSQGFFVLRSGLACRCDAQRLTLHKRRIRCVLMVACRIVGMPICGRLKLIAPASLDWTGLSCLMHVLRIARLMSGRSCRLRSWRLALLAGGVSRSKAGQTRPHQFSESCPRASTKPLNFHADKTTRNQHPVQPCSPRQVMSRPGLK